MDIHKKNLITRLDRMFGGSGYAYKSLLASLLGSYAIFILLPFSFIFYNFEKLGLNIQNLNSFIIYFIFGYVLFVVLSLCARKLIKFDLSPVYAVIFLYLFIASWIVPNNTGPLDGLRDSQVFNFGEDTLYQLGKVFVISLVIIFVYYKNRKLFEETVIICFIGSLFLVAYTATNFQYETKTKVKAETIKLADLSLNKNIIIISFDAIQGDFMDNIIQQNPLLLDGFDGFTFYPDTASADTNTLKSTFLTLIGSIPPLKPITKVWAGENQRKILPFILANEGNYRISTYGPDSMIGGILCRDTSIPDSCFAYDAFFDQYGNSHNSDFRKINDSMFYSALRVLPPYAVKVANDTFNDIHIAETGLEMATQDKGKLGMGRSYYEYLSFIENLNAKHVAPVFTYQHYVFTHEPVTFDNSCSYTYSENTPQNIESAKEQILCVISLMKRTISKLKDIGVYDNSMIIFMSDHGMSSSFNAGSNINLGGFMPAARYNAFLMIKDFNSEGNAIVSQLPVSLLDVAPTVCYSAMSPDFCINRGYEGINLKSLKEHKNRGRKLLMYTGGKEALSEDFSRYWDDLSLFEAITFRGDIKTGLENYFENSHPYRKQFPNELLLNGDFSSGLSHWTQVGINHAYGKGVVVNLANHLFQDVGVDENRTYLITYDITCASGATMRAQVNWYGAAGTFISATGERYVCNGEDRIINKVIKPPSGSTVGRFYITADDDRDVIVKSVSFRGDIITGLENYFENSHPYRKQFPNELLLNGDFSSGLSHWTQVGINHAYGKGVVVNLANHLFQDVGVDENRTYLITYDITCASGATMRAQVNWHDAAGTFISATGGRYVCNGEDRIINKVVKPPSGSTVGRFYITADDDRDVIVKSVSFR